ncbi:UTP--glucose-1-phosphate uridylyltransferase [Candidatus Shapirobacteria bacterium CG09_land_8_20_14_0_10_47_13]|uniref:UTP--glucose-1-phosphate uridylyltransferase n=1 Tax=Candidatus Shapirobacteria bacterium CG09_land_8_20_14_0_10_47_13 TaxID=1974481 RepID=A0A2H0WQ88_9BACT|nr:MAG: UTP--glucose-1-phosphate uridylyltransferase [Candidatus Shapirobacteria bacterium CG09_land_8_20_14_0_10_47_13]
MTKVTKAVIPVAGFGTRFLPVTKAIPKEMLPIIDKPIVQFIVEELVAAGIKDIIFVTSGYKKAIEDYFNPHFELEYLLEKNGKEASLEQIRRLSELANFISIRQKKMAGNGDAILTAEPVVGDEPFLAYWADEIFLGQPSRTKQLLAAFNQYGASILGALESEDPADGTKYGFAAGQEVVKGVLRIKGVVEKPGLGKAPSDFAIFCSLFTPAIFPALRQAKAKIGDTRELVYLDGAAELLKKEPLYALKFKNMRHLDCGNKLGYLQAIVEFGLKDPELGKDFRKYLHERVA